MKWVVEALDATHEREHFNCGQASLEEYIRKYAGQQGRKNLGRTFVATRQGSPLVLGYYTLSSSSVAFEHVPEGLRRKLPRYPMPCALLGRLAVDQSVQRQGLGEFLLIDALRRVVEAAEHMAIFAVEVHAVDGRARAFYQKYGFRAFQDHPLHLFLPLATIKQSFG